MANLETRSDPALPDLQQEVAQMLANLLRTTAPGPPTPLNPPLHPGKRLRPNSNLLLVVIINPRRMIDEVSSLFDFQVWWCGGCHHRERKVGRIDQR